MEKCREKIKTKGAVRTFAPPFIKRATAAGKGK
jgi:hypothetical protein